MVDDFSWCQSVVGRIRNLVVIRIICTRRSRRDSLPLGPDHKKQKPAFARIRWFINNLWRILCRIWSTRSFGRSQPRSIIILFQSSECCLSRRSWILEIILPGTRGSASSPLSLKFFGYVGGKKIYIVDLQLIILQQFLIALADLISNSENL